MILQLIGLFVIVGIPSLSPFKLRGVWEPRGRLRREARGVPMAPRDEDAQEGPHGGDPRLHSPSFPTLGCRKRQSERGRLWK